jgi:hypothetical protein
MSPENILMPHSTHSIIVDVKPTFSITTISIRVEHVNRIALPTPQVTVVIEYAVERVAPRMRAS